MTASSQPPATPPVADPLLVTVKELEWLRTIAYLVARGDSDDEAATVEALGADRWRSRCTPTGTREGAA